MEIFVKIPLTIDEKIDNQIWQDGIIEKDFKIQNGGIETIQTKKHLPYLIFEGESVSRKNLLDVFCYLFRLNGGSAGIRTPDK